MLESNNASNIASNIANTNDEEVDVFVPGRLCILGEHSDWAAEYRTENPSIAYGK